MASDSEDTANKKPAHHAGMQAKYKDYDLGVGLWHEFVVYPNSPSVNSTVSSAVTPE